MKLAWRSWVEGFKERAVLTPEEKRIIVFVLIAFGLGLATKHYRDTHPQAPVKIDKKHLATPAKSPRKPRKKANPAPVAPEQMQAQPGKD